MLYSVFGNDRDKAGKKARELAQSLREKRNDAVFVHLTEDDVTPEKIQEVIGGQGLFEQKLIVFLDRIGEKKANKELLVSALPDIKSSQNIFLLLEGQVDARLKTQLEKFSEKAQEFSAPKEVKEEFSLFQITDAYGARDKKRLWYLYEEALKRGVEVEQVHGMLFWQAKNLLLAKQEKDAKSAGLNPFVFSKASLYAKKFTDDEVLQHIASLVDVYHRSRRGEVEFELELERMILAEL